MKIIGTMKMYTSQEIADMLSITLATLAEYRERGLIRSVKVGASKLTSEEALNDYLSGRTTPCAAPSRLQRAKDAATNKKSEG